MGRQRRHHPFERHFRRAIEGIDGDVGLGVDRVALGDQPLEHRPGLAVLEQRPIVAPRHPVEQQIELGAQPDRHRALADERPGGRVHERAAAGRQDLHRSVEQAGDDAALAIAKRRLAVALEDFLDGLAGGGFDLGVGVGERHFEPLRQAPADARLACPHQPDEHHGTRQRRQRRAGHGAAPVRRPRDVEERTAHPLDCRKFAMNQP